MASTLAKALTAAWAAAGIGGAVSPWYLEAVNPAPERAFMQQDGSEREGLDGAAHRASPSEPFRMHGPSDSMPGSVDDTASPIKKAALFFWTDSVESVPVDAETPKWVPADARLTGVSAGLTQAGDGEFSAVSFANSFAAQSVRRTAFHAQVEAPVSFAAASVSLSSGVPVFATDARFASLSQAAGSSGSEGVTALSAHDEGADHGGLLLVRASSAEFSLFESDAYNDPLSNELLASSAAPVPEPKTSALLLAGFLVIWLVARRKRSRY
jgi:hypothetical protein